MTRINCVPVEDLHYKHLIAEYRELPRVFGLVRNWYMKNGTSLKVLDHYTMGTGHVKFFYNKLAYLSKRHKQLIQEMINRNYSPKFIGDLREDFNDIPEVFWNDWTPDSNALSVNKQRILDRLPKRK